ncbi:MAG TPA: hypothetical protein VGE52_02330, partial [Pirellulales bacterium]
PLSLAAGSPANRARRNAENLSRACSDHNYGRRLWQNFGKIEQQERLNYWHFDLSENYAHCLAGLSL